MTGMMTRSSFLTRAFSSVGSMHVMGCLQLSGTAGTMQLASPKLAGIFNMGGAAVANYVSILEPVK